MKLHYLGPAGTFSEAAANSFRTTYGLDAELSPSSSISQVVTATANEGGMGVVPYYNLIDGLVQESLDRVLATRLVLNGGLQLPIRIALGGPDDVPDNAPVYSHPKALAQCSEYLDAHHPKRPRRPVSSTAEGVEQAVANNALGLAGLGAFTARGLHVLSEDATNRYFGRLNYTEFLLIRRASDAAATTDAADNRSVLAFAPQTDRPGLLADILGLLSLFEINLARLHSRPAIAAAPTQLDPQVFYIETAGSVEPKVLALCADSLAHTLGGDERRQVLFHMGSYALNVLPQD